MVCNACRIGRRQLATVPYLYELNGEVMVFPHAPADVCDVCGRIEYDKEFVEAMEMMVSGLNPEESDLTEDENLPSVKRGIGLRRQKRA